jgi:hypothetical protein
MSTPVTTYGRVTDGRARNWKHGRAATTVRSRRRAARRLLGILLGLGLVVATPGVSAAAGLPAVLTQGRPAFEIKPATISYTGDGTGLVGGADGRSVRHPGHLEWSTYTRRQGIAHGVVWLDDCDPDCAEGTFTSTPVSVHVFSPAHGRFGRMTLTYTYQGKRYVDRRAIRHYPGGAGFSGYWAYAIVGG